MGCSLMMVTIKLIIPQYIFSMDEVTQNKEQVFQTVLNVIERDLGVRVNGLSINYDYSKNVLHCAKSLSHNP